MKISKKSRKEVCADYRNRHRCQNNKMTGSEEKYLSKIYFRGAREIVVKRDNYKCCRCDAESSLIVHHVDRNKKNNKLNNLITLCKSCHINEHHEIRRNADKGYLCQMCNNQFIRKSYLTKKKHIFCSHKCSALYRWNNYEK